jgi:hypothetical protein
MAYLQVMHPVLTRLMRLVSDSVDGELSVISSSVSLLPREDPIFLEMGQTCRRLGKHYLLFSVA